jgi:RNA polymerase sigma-70 factor (subfamily 1)
MGKLDGWNLTYYREVLHRRARWLIQDSRMSGKFDTSDLVQEALLRATVAESFPDENSGDAERLAWLISIQNNIAIDKVREYFAKKRDIGREIQQQQLAQMSQWLDESTVNWANSLPTKDPPPPQLLVENEERHQLLVAIEQLPERERAVMKMRVIEQLTVPEIAQQLQETEGAVAGLIRRAEKRLKKKS